MPRSWLRAASSASWPTPARSWSWSWNPVALPSSVIAGGANAKICASLICANALVIRCATAAALRSGASRSSQRLSFTNTRPEFWPRPTNENPLITSADSTESCSFVIR
jgi:hypothetical protein